MSRTLEDEQAMAHSDSKWLKLAGNKSTQSDFKSFDMKVSANLHYFRFQSLPWLHIQICQIIAVAIMIRQFHQFFKSSIGWVFDNWPNCASAVQVQSMSLVIQRGSKTLLHKGCLMEQKQKETVNHLTPTL